MRITALFFAVAWILWTLSAPWWVWIGFVLCAWYDMDQAERMAAAFADVRDRFATVANPPIPDDD